MRTCSTRERRRREVRSSLQEEQCSNTWCQVVRWSGGQDLAELGTVGCQKSYVHHSLEVTGAR